MVDVAVRLNKLPSEILSLPVDEYELLLGYLTLESRAHADGEREAAKKKAKAKAGR